MSTNLRQLKQKHEFADAYSLIKAQCPTLSEPEYWRLLGEMMFAGQLIVGLYLHERLIGLIGIRKAADWLYGEHLWLHMFSLAAEHHNQGHEDTMLGFVYEWAQAQGCKHIYSTLDLPSRATSNDGFLPVSSLLTLHIEPLVAAKASVLEITK